MINRFVSGRFPATEKEVQALLLMFERLSTVPTFKVNSWSKLRPFSGRSLICASVISPEVELSVVFTSGASSITVTFSATLPTSSVRFTTAS